MQQSIGSTTGTGANAPVENAEAELQKLRQVVIHLAKLSAIGTTAAMLAHEVAQPVTAAANYMGAAQRRLTAMGDGASEASALLALAQDCMIRAAGTMRKVRELAANKAFQARQLNLQAVVSDVLKLYGQSWEVRPQIVIPVSAARVIGDPTQLAQVFSNLVRNALEATEGQAERHVRICSRVASDEAVEVRIEDNGPGISPAMNETLFLAFHSSKPDGLGVGLSICRAIVEQHGGRIWTEKMPNGTAFCFTLPKGAEL